VFGYILNFDIRVSAANEAFDGVECVSWVGDCLAAGGHAD